MKRGDPSLIRIEDPSGNFVGTQTGIPVEDVKNAIPAEVLDETLSWYENSPQIQKETIDGQEVFLMTGYTRDPETVCGDAPATPSDRIYIKHGDGYLEVERTGDTKLVDDGWVKQPCVPKMGDHYRYKATMAVDFDCKDWTPAFLIYKGGDNIGYGWNWPGTMNNDNYENSSEAGFNSIMVPMPTCLTKQFSDNKGYRSQHIYLIGNPQNVTCPTS